MLMLLSPAKNMRTPTRPAPLCTAPRFAEQTEALYELLRPLAPYELESLMHISPALALRTCEDFARWQPEGGVPAVLSYDGLAYKNLSADTLDDDTLLYAQEHLRILSAFYGVLRPLDCIHPYRLEMAHKPACGSLYRFWGDRLYRDVYAAGDAVINLASAEYSKAVSAHLTPRDSFITCEFLTYRKGKLKCLSTLAKMARGQMVRFALERRIDTPAGLTAFDWNGFAFEPALSSGTVMTFVQN